MRVIICTILSQGHVFCDVSFIYGDEEIYMQCRLFNNSSTDVTNQKISKKDAEFLKSMLEAMQNFQYRAQKEYDNLNVTSRSSLPYTPPEIREELEEIRLLLSATDKRMETLKKILNDQSITKDEQLFVLKDKYFKNSIVSRYEHVVEQNNTPKPLG